MPKIVTYINMYEHMCRVWRYIMKNRPIFQRRAGAVPGKTHITLILQKESENKEYTIISHQINKQTQEY